jgi:hypothetical protein
MGRSASNASHAWGAPVKGIAHFLGGVALSTFVPGVVARAGDGGLLPVLGGMAGLLPDTIDFKFCRFFERYDVSVDPGDTPDAHTIAELIAGAMGDAVRLGTKRTVMLHTAREGPDLWRRYHVRICAEDGRVAVQIGPQVSTAGVPVPGSAPAGGQTAEVVAGVPVGDGQGLEVTVDAFSGPTVTFAPTTDGVLVLFLDWHRRWSHSPLFALVLGLAVAGFYALLETLCSGAASRMAITAGLVATLGVLGHIAVDQLGTMGSQLLYPFSRRRIRGLGLLHSGDALPNFLAVWTSVATILLNLDRLGGRPRIAPLRFMAFGIGLPVLLLGGAYLVRRRAPVGARPLPPPEVASEMVDVDLG